MAPERSDVEGPEGHASGEAQDRGDAAGTRECCIFVLGMHRSGTSCLAGSLQARGLHLANVDEWDKYNPKGNRENKAVMRLNEQLLKFNEASWKKPPAQPRWNADHEKARDAILADMRAAGHARWGLKDPRMLFLLDFWAGSPQVPRYECVATFRHPGKVAMSLHRRNGMPVEEALGIWLDHNRRLLELRRTLPIPLVCFDVDHEAYRRQVDRLARSIGLVDEAAAGADADFFEEGLRSVKDEDACEVGEAAREVYEALCAAHAAQERQP